MHLVVGRTGRWTAIIIGVIHSRVNLGSTFKAVVVILAHSRRLSRRGAIALLWRGALPGATASLPAPLPEVALRAALLEPYAADADVVIPAAEVRLMAGRVSGVGPCPLPFVF
jgi:hypothetical protein